MIKLKSQKGIGGTDAIIAVVLIALFAGLIATLSYNIYVANSSLKRMSTATGYITDIFEYVDKTYYEDVTEDKLVTYVNDKADSNKEAYDKNYDKTQAKSIKSEEISKYTNAAYKIDIKVEKYDDANTTTTELDLVKTITVKVNYKLQGKDQTLEMSKIKKRESLITPNKPDLSLITKADDSNNIYPIKYINNEWQVTNENDATWYNYNNGYWAVAIETTNTYTEGNTIDNIENLTVYIWVPRYAYKTTDNTDNTDIKFLYSTTNKYVNLETQEENVISYNKLKEINEYTTNNNVKETGKWIDKNQVSVLDDEELNRSIYKMKNVI